MQIMNYIKAESAIIIVLEMLLAIFKNWKKLRVVLRKKATRVKTDKI